MMDLLKTSVADAFRKQTNMTAKVGRNIKDCIPTQTMHSKCDWYFSKMSYPQIFNPM